MIRFGILGLGNIAHRFARSAQLNPNVTIEMVASSSQAKGEAFCQKYGIRHYTQDYTQLMDHPAIDAVYIAVPHGRHAALVEQCLHRHKAVLCEKPLGLNAAEVSHLMQVAASEQVFLMEAVKGYFLPARDQLKEVLKQGAIGTPFYLEANFDSVVPYQKGKYLFEKGQGGALLDVGIYPLSFALDMFDGDPVVAQSKLVMSQGIDTYFQALLNFADGQSCLLEGSIDRARPRVALIQGTQGTLEIPYYYRCQEFTVTSKGQSQKYESSWHGDDMSGEIQEVVSCLQAGLLESRLHPLCQSLKLAQLLDDIRTKAVCFDVG